MDTRDRYDGPPFWFVVFTHTFGTPWVDRLIIGRFKHCFAVGYFPNARAWVKVNPTLRGIDLDVMRKEEAGNWLDCVSYECAVLKVTAGRRTKPRVRAFWCTPAVAALVGSTSNALTPDRLWRDLLREGAEIVANGHGEEVGPGRRRASARC